LLGVAERRRACQRIFVDALKSGPFTYQYGYHDAQGEMMRPTKEMIIETKQLVNKTNQNIKQIIKANDHELNTIRNKEEQDRPIKPKFIYWIVIMIFILLSYPVYRFFFSK